MNSSSVNIGNTIQGSSVLVWFRRDLRVADNPALSAAVATGRRVVPVYIWSDADESPWAVGQAQGWWIRKSLESLQLKLNEVGLTLVIRSGAYGDVLSNLVGEVSAQTIFMNRRYEPHATAVESELVERLGKAGVETCQFESSLLHLPEEVTTKAGGPYRVFTPFWRRLQSEMLVPAPLSRPGRVSGSQPALVNSSTDSASTTNADAEYSRSWRPGEDGGHQALEAFVASTARDYDAARNTPGQRGTSRLSPYLANGELSPRQVWHAMAGSSLADSDPVFEPYLRQLVWRDFSYHVLVSNPSTPTDPLNPRFGAFPWRSDSELLQKWQEGLTGYPIVDAGMRELRSTGWMHNRVRMVVASFLTKHLLINWQEGADWFWRSLVDADLANNTMGWQWSAGCGADAQPYFRIFNPMNQGKKFDPDGAYVRRWLPELDGLSNRDLHHPWTLSRSDLAKCGVELGATYPNPIVEHGFARQRALAAYDIVRS